MRYKYKYNNTQKHYFNDTTKTFKLQIQTVIYIHLNKIKINVI